MYYIIICASLFSFVTWWFQIYNYKRNTTKVCYDCYVKCCYIVIKNINVSIMFQSEKTFASIWIYKTPHCLDPFRGGYRIWVWWVHVHIFAAKSFLFCKITWRRFYVVLWLYITIYRDKNVLVGQRYVKIYI